MHRRDAATKEHTIVCPALPPCSVSNRRVQPTARPVRQPQLNACELAREQVAFRRVFEVLVLHDLGLYDAVPFPRSL